MSPSKEIDLARIGAARKRISKYVAETPLKSWDYLRRTLNFEAPIFLKMETLQNTGAFKVRGAANKILSLIESGEKPKHLVAASAGNHAQAVAYVAGKLGIPCTIVMPEGSPLVKVAATQDYGAQVVLAGVIYDEAYARAQEILNSLNGAVYVHAYEDLDIICGQGTMGLEIHDQLSALGVKEGPIQAVIPIGGGGLVSGVASALQFLRPGSKIFGVVSQAAPAMAESFAKGSIVEAKPGRSRTLAEGLAVKRVSALTFEIIKKRLEQVTIVDDDEIAMAISTLMERGKLLAEGSGAAGVAALLTHKYHNLDPKIPTVVVLCGGNIDLNLLSNILERGFLRSSRWLAIEVLVEDKPGELTRLTQAIAQSGVNVLEVNHDRIRRNCPVGRTYIGFLLETRGPAHAKELQSDLQNRGYHIEVRQ